MDRLKTYGRCAAVGAFLVAHSAILLNSIHKNFVTVDEVGHVASGISHWQTGTFAAYRVNPPLPRMLAVLPIFLTEVQTDYDRFNTRPGSRPEVALGIKFSELNKERYFALICLARLAGIAWSVLGALVIYKWTGELFGLRGALLALAVWSFEPNILAHAPLVTPDVPATVAGLFATYAFWRYIRSPSWGSAYLAGLLLGVAQLTKFTLLVLYVVWPTLWLADRVMKRRHAGNQQHHFQVELGQAATIFLLSILVINLGYGFSNSFTQLKEYFFVSKTLAGDGLNAMPSHNHGTSSNRFANNWLGLLDVPLPMDYVMGIDLQKRDFEIGTRSYLAGHIRNYGWWYYYLYGLGIKVPVGILILVLLVIVLTILSNRKITVSINHLFLCLPPLAVLVLVSSQTGFNHHLRYVLPLFPFAIIIIG